MKVWIVHDSKFGNGKSLAETMGQVFQEKMDVEIAHVKSIFPHRVAEEKPELIVVGTAIRAFSSSLASKMWIRRLKKELRKVNHIIPLGVVFITHVMKKETVQFWGKRFLNILDRGIAIGEVYPEWLSGKVIAPEGPLAEGIIEEIKHHSRQILANIG
jgi:menaquinone-dependent protoporphyrinogen IX oxidase